MSRGPSKPFKPGNNHNPLGAAAHNPVKKALKRLTENELVDIVTQLVLGDANNLRTAVEDIPNSSVIKSTFAYALAADMKKGKTDTMFALLERLLGKPKERVEMTGSDGGPIHTVNELQVKSMIDKLESEF